MTSGAADRFARVLFFTKIRPLAAGYGQSPVRVRRRNLVSTHPSTNLKGVLPVL
jgi:hypothetical protein